MMIIAGLVADGTGRKYGDWQHVATGCNALVRVTLLRIKSLTSGRLNAKLHYASWFGAGSKLA